MIVRYLSDGTIQKSRPSFIENVKLSEESAKDPAAVSQAIQKLSSQVQELASRNPANSKEFEFSLAGGATRRVKMIHGFNGKVRFWVCNYESANAAVQFTRESANSDLNTLTLTFGLGAVSGTVNVCIRVEPAQ